MKRRTASARGDLPARLARFDVADWLPADVWDAYSLWTAARHAWVEAGNAWPGGEAAMAQKHVEEARRLPDQPFVPVIGVNI